MLSIVKIRTDIGFYMYPIHYGLPQWRSTINKSPNMYPSCYNCSSYQLLCHNITTEYLVLFIPCVSLELK